MNITYRLATQADESVIRALLQSQKLPVESIGSGITDFFLAEETNVVVGVAGFEYYGEDSLLRSVAVPTSLQKKQIGSQMVDWMISLAKKKNIKRIVLLTETASKFFAKKGFGTVDRSVITNAAMKKSSQFGGCCCSSAVCMTLSFIKE